MLDFFIFLIFSILNFPKLTGSLLFCSYPALGREMAIFVENLQKSAQTVLGISQDDTSSQNLKFLTLKCFFLGFSYFLG